MAIKARSSGHPFASKTNGNEERLQSSAPFFPFQMIYGLSGNWRIECSIDIDQHSSFAIAADPVFLTAVAVVGQPELDVFSSFGDVMIKRGFVDVRTSIRDGLATHH